MEQPKRKQNRIKDFDYSQNGAYFVTICTKDKHSLLWNGVTITDGIIPMSYIGDTVNRSIENIHLFYPNIIVDKYVIMPNHVHMILIIKGDHNGNRRTLCAPTISQVIKQMKEYATKQIGFSIWQRSFHDHIIRNERDYLEIWNYIDTNPLKWEQDKYHE